MSFTNWTKTVEQYLAEGRPVSGGKGDPYAQQAEILGIQNMGQQIKFSQQLMDIFTKQYGDQKQILDFLKAKMTPMIENPQGYGQDALTAMRTKATDTISRNANNAQQAYHEGSFSRGGRDLPSGVDSQIDAALLNEESAQKSDAQNNITMADADLKQKNYWNAVNVLGGTGATMAPTSYAGAAEGSANAASGASNAVSAASAAYKNSKKGFWSNLAESAGSALGNFLGGGHAGTNGFFGMGNG